MNRITVISTAIGLALTMHVSAQAQGMSGGGMSGGSSMSGGMSGGMAGDKAPSEKCFGINAAGKNDCRANGVAGPGKSDKARTGAAWVRGPVGLCEKIDGGNLKPAM